MQKQISKLHWELCKLDMMINIFSDAYNYCMEDGKSTEHLFFLNKLIAKKVRYIRHKCDEIDK